MPQLNLHSPLGAPRGESRVMRAEKGAVGWMSMFVQSSSRSAALPGRYRVRPSREREGEVEQAPRALPLLTLETKF